MMLALLACAAPDDDEKPDADADTDSDTDTDTDSDADSDTDSDPGGCAADRWDPATFATVIEVGPGTGVETPGDVPWESLGAGTLVRISTAGSPYAAKWAIDAAGTEDAPIVVIGVCDPDTGELPVIDGRDAVTREALDYWNEDRGIVKIGGTSTGEGVVPAWVYVEDLEIRGARGAFTDEAGEAATYADNAAAFYVEEGEHVTVRGCTLADSGNGIFASSDTSDLTVSSNHVYDNGNPGSAYEHNNYTEALGIIFEYNWFGPPCDGCDGNNLKDRSAGTVIRYNRIEGGNRQIDLVESDHDALVDDPSYRVTYVYGNVLVEPEDDGNSQILHYGGDGGDTSRYRRGTLFFYHNTVVSERAGNTTLARLSDVDEVLDARNNVLYAAGTLGVLSTDGSATLACNWLPTGWRSAIEGDLPVTDEGGNVTGDDPGFADGYALADGSAAIDAGGDLADGAPPAERQYVHPQGGEPRVDEGAADMGAFGR
ncbi:MAG: right-handed parallel beta-helix repeat-containing protein [Myxococcota bacterium]